MPVNEASNDSMPSSPLSLDHLSFHTHSIGKKILQQSKSRKMLIGNDGVQNTSESHSSSIQSDIDFLGVGDVICTTSSLIVLKYADF